MAGAEERREHLLKEVSMAFLEYGHPQSTYYEETAREVYLNNRRFRLSVDRLVCSIMSREEE